MLRLENWPERLEQAIRSAERVPFEWGRLDCCLFAANCVEATLGFDPAARLRGSYSTRGQAFRVLRRTFGGGVEQVMERMAQAHGWDEIPVLRARRGDVAAVVSPDGHPSLAVVDASGRWLAFPGDGGLSRVSLSSGLRAWSVE